MKRPWLIPATAGVVGLGTLLVIGIRAARSRRAAFPLPRPGKDPWNLSPPVDDAQATNGWGEPRAYRCPCDTEAPFNTNTKCKTSAGTPGYCSFIPIHEGIDFAGGAGKVLRAMADGVIVAVDRDPNTHAGRVVSIDYGLGLSSSYLHMSRIESWVAVGVKVRRGSAVGLSGSSGADGDGSFTPHLHTTMRMQPSGLALYQSLFGKPKSGWGGKTSLGYAVPAEPLIPAKYPSAMITKARQRGVAQPRQITGVA